MTLFRFVLFLVLVASIYSKQNDDFESVKKGITELFQTGNKPYFTNVAKSYQLPHVFREHMEKVYNNKEICILCNLLFDLVIDEWNQGMTKEKILDIVQYICVELGIENERVCHGSITINADIIFYIIEHYPDIKANRLCGSVLQAFGCSTGEDFDWSIIVPPGNAAKRPQLNDESSGSFNILQLSDIHYDPNYKPYGKAKCGEPVCCQEDQGEADSPDTACGYWSDYRFADVPWHLVEETIRHTKTQDFDYVYYTGDIISHRVWQTTVENNTKTISKLYSYFKQAFDVPVFPIFGNHEPHPLNVWPDDQLQDETLSVKWLFKLAADEWSKLIGQDVSETVLKGGYYSVSPRPGFRVIGVNGNLCYTDNWWLIYDDVDPFNQLQWLADTLEQAEAANESVHILSHVPTGDISCLKVWSREYHRIVERFSSTITGQFNGHTHRDEFHVYYNSSAPNQAIGVAFNGASVTPYDSSNPSYKVYRVDQSTYTLLDYEEWTFNLTLANSQPVSETPEWYKLYSFIQAYGVNNLQAIEVDKVLYKMTQDHSLLDDYFRFKFRNGDDGIKAGCSETCRKENLCDIAKAQFADNTQCDYFLQLYEQGKQTID
ncbi:sphingomyelin phosphodiesterase-like [Tribolium madens]|uniref:sphingomyelin phosphodiesterase-like n=1 Tax=Tribolium madens TaxID=41895 RepID=UPI001CF75C0B|nr:sphingomyelin phosphodiesterase-like [Tribolium madens]